MKKKILIGALVLILILTVVLILSVKKEKTETLIPDDKPLNTQANLEEIIELIKAELIDTSGSTETNQEESTISTSSEEVSEEKVEEEVNTNAEGSNRETVSETQSVKDESEIDFREYSGLTKKAIVLTNDYEVNEAWLVKLTSYEQQEEISRIFGNRIIKLRQAFQNNDEQLRIINNALIKQEDGIVIMVISPEREKLEKLIASQM